MKYLNDTGLSYFWDKIKNLLDRKADKVIDTRQYTGYYCHENTDNGRDVFCMRVKRNS